MLDLRPATVIRLALALLLVGNLVRVPVLETGAKDAPIFFNDLLIVGVLMVGFAAALRARSWRLDGPGALAIGFAVVGLVSALLAVPRFGLSGFELLFSLAYLARWLAYFGVYLVVINSVSAADIPPIWRALEGMILVFAAFGIVQSLFLPGFAQIVYPSPERLGDWDPQGHRLVSTLLDPNFAGGLIVMGLLVVLARIALGIAVPAWKPVLLLAALILTLSRSSFVAFAVGGMVVLAARGLSRRLLHLAGLATLLSLPFLPPLLDLARAYNRFGIDPSALTRVTAWLRGLAVFADNPVLGVGFNTYGFVQRSYGWLPGGKATFSLDGGLLFIAVMTGLVGLVLYTAMVALVVRRSRRIWRDAAQSPEHRGLAIGITAATAATLVHSVFVNSLLFPFIMEPLWVLWALSFVMSAPERRRAAVARGPGVALLASVLRTRSG